jgi:transcriptional regulator with XRE-family HTH domain
MYDYYTFGQRLKFLRKYRNMSQDAVSLVSGIDRSYISEIETGKSSPTAVIIYKIAKALNVEPSELLKDGVSEPERTYEGELYKRTD